MKYNQMVEYFRGGIKEELHNSGGQMLFSEMVRIMSPNRMIPSERKNIRDALASLIDEQKIILYLHDTALVAMLYTPEKYREVYESDPIPH